MNLKTATLFVVASLPLQGCWFSLAIPGNVTGAVSDAFTGAQGANCVAPSVKVGDHVRLPDGNIGTVKSLSGASSRCNDTRRPIRAEVLADTGGAGEATPPAYASRLRLDLPTGWESKPVPENVAKRGWFVYAVNRNIDVGAELSATTHEGITDIGAYAQTRRSEWIGELTGVIASELSELEVNGRRALQVTVTGRVKSGQTITYLGTLIEGEKEIAVLLTWTAPANDQQRDAMAHLAECVVGFEPN